MLTCTAIQHALELDHVLGVVPMECVARKNGKEGDVMEPLVEAIIMPVFSNHLQVHSSYYF